MYTLIQCSADSDSNELRSDRKLYLVGTLFDMFFDFSNSRLMSETKKKTIEK